MKRKRSENAGVEPLLRVLSRGRPEEVCAAAIVLGALHPATPEVVRALKRKLARASVVLAPYLLEAIARQGTDEALAVLVPFVTESGARREQSVRLLTAAGPRAVAVLEHASRRREAGDRLLLIRTGLLTMTPAGVDWVVRELWDANETVARGLFRVLRPLCRSFPLTLRRRLADRLLRMVERGSDGERLLPRIVALRLLRQVSDASLAGRLMALVEHGHDSDLCSHVLGVLQMTRIPAALQPTLRARLEPLVFDADVLRVAIPAFAILARQRPSVFDDALLARIERDAAPPIRFELARQQSNETRRSRRAASPGPAQN